MLKVTKKQSFNLSQEDTFGKYCWIIHPPPTFTVNWMKNIQIEDRRRQKEHKRKIEVIYFIYFMSVHLLNYKEWFLTKLIINLEA